MSILVLFLFCFWLPGAFLTCIEAAGCVCSGLSGEAQALSAQRCSAPAPGCATQVQLPRSFWGLRSPPRDQRWILNQWTTKEVPIRITLINIYWLLYSVKNQITPWSLWSAGQDHKGRKREETKPNCHNLCEILLVPVSLVSVTAEPNRCGVCKHPRPESCACLTSEGPGRVGAPCGAGWEKKEEVQENRPPEAFAAPGAASRHMEPSPLLPLREGSVWLSSWCVAACRCAVRLPSRVPRTWRFLA